MRQKLVRGGVLESESRDIDGNEGNQVNRSHVRRQRREWPLAWLLIDAVECGRREGEHLLFFVVFICVFV